MLRLGAFSRLIVFLVATLACVASAAPSASSASSAPSVSSASSAPSASSTPSTSSAIGPVADLPIVNGKVCPDGISRDAVLPGGTFPGTLITGKKGDNFKINVIDQLTNETMLLATSIHWHGLFQHGSNWADGGAGVNQCPIVSGNSFLYEFDAVDQAGTYWYHSHLQTQYCDGLRGPLVVYDPEDPHASLYDVDDESTVITLADWYHTAAQVLQNTVGAVTADATLFNGLGRWAGNPTSDLAVIKVTPGKRYRFRLINIACDPNYQFQIDGHNMTIIEADGQNTKPLTVDKLTVFSAQRYSFVLEANQPIGNYWMRADPSTFKTSPNGSGFKDGINSAILRYDGAPEEEPTTTQDTSVNELQEYNLHPLTDPAAPDGEIYPLTLGLNFTGGKFTVNDVSFEPPKVPVLLQILSGAQNAQDLLPAGSVYSLPPNKTIEVSIPALNVGGPHPFHLHGHAFSVVRSAGQKEPNYVDPVRRDVVSIGKDMDNVTIRFRTDNPGPWFLHCHIDWHLQNGLAVVFAEDIADTAVANPVPQAWSDLCPEYAASMEA
ncbi:laccase C [Daedaleopsis nitida]|nr:laccase C [Daedaleopsis nitida]